MTDGLRFPDGTRQRDGHADRLPARPPSRVIGILSRLRAALKSRVPLGYEDKTGFHTGAFRSED